MGTWGSRTRMKGVFVLVALSVAGAIALETELDPAIPRDKCGVTVGINEDDRAELFILGADKTFYHKYEQGKGRGRLVVVLDPHGWVVQGRPDGCALQRWPPRGVWARQGQLDLAQVPSRAQLALVDAVDDARLEDQVHVQPCGDLVFRGLHSLVRQGCRQLVDA